MNRLWRQLKVEWEAAFCMAAAIVFLAALVVGWLRLSAAPEERASRKQTPKQSSLLSQDAYAFLTPTEAPDTELPSPFVFEGKTKAPKVTPKATPPEPKPKPRPKPKPEPKVTKPEPVKPKVVTPEPPKTVKRRIYGVRYMKYLYSARNTAGKPVATVQLADPVSKQTGMPAMVPIGGAIQGIRVISFDEQKLVVQDARGKRHRIAFGKAVKLSSTPRIVEVPR